MGILGSILGKRDNGMPYRTVDGGHPAPYPDMTDEQLYNYEMAFNVPRRTFDRPPTPAPAPGQAQPAARGGRQEPSLATDGMATEQAVEAPPAAAPRQMEDEQESEERRFDAPRYTARAQTGAADASTLARTMVNPALPSRTPAPPLDFSRPVRMITTRQPVEIITTRARHPVYKVHGYIGDDDVVTVFTSDGRLSENGLPYLENVPEMERLYLNIYLNRDGISTDRFVVTQHPTREAADAEAEANAQKGKGDRIKCVDVELDL
ncbi:hypothetical protein [Noviherbaspirillum aridicola]|uniref:Uncharacterized protein n=1 Tax=Noviherbaspirillum aridicola TaxID=2849687 RepID=A0ABQ4Q6A1_9BURK|nr:hypothetical protein [Noviherbaspirillum aridicola]GIZ52330.1 hypothetical protein NCCP691_23440 [Noviherbaspirillum aridicola]